MRRVLRIGSVVLNVGDVPRAMAFWAAALGYEPRDFVVLADPDGNRFCVIGARGR